MESKEEIIATLRASVSPSELRSNAGWQKFFRLIGIGSTLPIRSAALEAMYACMQMGRLNDAPRIFSGTINLANAQQDTIAKITRNIRTLLAPSMKKDQPRGLGNTSTGT